MSTKQPSSAACPYLFFEHERGITIHFDLDLFDQTVLFNLLKTIEGFEIVGGKNVFQSFGPLESADEFQTPLGKFMLGTSWEGIDTGHSFSSANKEFVKQVIKRLQESPDFITYEEFNKAKEEIRTESDLSKDIPVVEQTPLPPPENLHSSKNNQSQESGCGAIFVFLIFMVVTVMVISSTISFYDDLSIDLSRVKQHQGIVIHRSITKKSQIRSNSGFNLELAGLDHRFRFFHGDFKLLNKEITTGEVITIFYSNYSYELYQIQKSGKVLLDKREFENKQWVGVVMGTIFSLFSIWCTVFIFKRL